MQLEAAGKTYRIKFGYNSFCDTDLMDRTSDLLKLFSGAKTEDDKDVSEIGKIKDLFCCVRDLLFVGFEKYNPVNTPQDIGDILDDYKDEASEEDPRSLVNLFIQLTDELMSEGFLSDLMRNAEEKTPKTPQDHKRPKKNATIQK